MIFRLDTFLTNISSCGYSLDDNSFTGTIPAKLSTLTYLYELWLQNNELVGTLPEVIYRDLSNAYSIRVEGNDLDSCPANQPVVICS